MHIKLCAHSFLNGRENTQFAFGQREIEGEAGIEIERELADC